MPTPPIKQPSVQAHILTELADDAASEGDTSVAEVFLKRAVRLTPKDTKVAAHYAELLRANGRVDDALTFLQERIDADPLSLPFHQNLVKIGMRHHRFEQVGDEIRRLLESPDPNARAFGQSAKLDLDLERRAQDLGVIARQRVPLWWMKVPYPGNFGDVLSPYLIDKLTGIPPRFVSRDKGLLAVGSIIRFATEQSVVWGSGTPLQDDSLSPAADYRAVRGPLTRDLVLRSGGTCPEVYGDPALLLPHVYRPKPREAARLGFIAHYTDRQRVRIGPGVRDISILRCGDDDLESFVDEVASCEAILSTSLHGLIVAHAYGVPARWSAVSGSGGISGDRTKFLDYFHSVDMPEQTILDIAEGDAVTVDFRRDVPDLRMSFDPAPLLAAFPTRIVASGYEAPGRPIEIARSQVRSNLARELTKAAAQVSRLAAVCSLATIKPGSGNWIAIDLAFDMIDPWVAEVEVQLESPTTADVPPGHLFVEVWHDQARLVCHDFGDGSLSESVRFINSGPEANLSLIVRVGEDSAASNLWRTVPQVRLSRCRWRPRPSTERARREG